VEEAGADGLDRSRTLLGRLRELSDEPAEADK
jgi:hypothetical protein